MARIGPPAIDTTWRYALLAGLVSLPFTTLSYWQTGSEVSLNAVFWAALLAGYLVKRRDVPSTPVGLRAGLIGGLPTLWMTADMIQFIVGLGGPAWFRVVQVAVMAGLLLVGFLFAALVGGLSARLGGWLAERNGHPRRPTAA